MLVLKACIGDVNTQHKGTKMQLAYSTYQVLIQATLLAQREVELAVAESYPLELRRDSIVRQLVREHEHSGLDELAAQIIITQVMQELGV